MDVKRIPSLAAILLLGSALAVVPAGAQSYEHAKAAVEVDHAHALATALGLTDAQQAQAKQLHSALLAKAEPLIAQHERQRKEVMTLLANAKANPTEVGQKMQAAYATAQKVRAAHDDFATHFSALLDAGQREKFQQIQKEHGLQEAFGFRAAAMKH